MLPATAGNWGEPWCVVMDMGVRTSIGFYRDFAGSFIEKDHELCYRYSTLQPVQFTRGIIYYKHNRKFKLWVPFQEDRMVL